MVVGVYLNCFEFIYTNFKAILGHMMNRSAKSFKLEMLSGLCTHESLCSIHCLDCESIKAVLGDYIA